MARKYNHLLNCGISHDKYMELKYFCKQYPEKRERLQSLTSTKAISYTDMPVGSGCSNPTEDLLLLKESLEEDIKLIEQTAIEADSMIYREILNNVTQGTCYEYLEVPYGRRQFYKIRQRFFFLLAKKK